MTAWRRAIELSMGGEDLAKLVSITRSRTESASRVERARMLAKLTLWLKDICAKRRTTAMVRA
jgi:hypothetical protein